VLHELEQLDRDLVLRPGHPLMGAPSLHASLIDGGRELSSYPDRCALKLERRTVPGESDSAVIEELETLLTRLHHADPEFEATLTPLFSRPPYALPADHDLPQALSEAMAQAQVHAQQRTARAEAPAPRAERFVGMSFWTDAAVLGSAGIPSVLFGPGGAGLHSTEEYVEIQDVLRCRDALAALARAW
jgi:acetylornithine deacetylase